ncbi:MAG: hypothetical protein HY371_18475 [Devosia nanyangense]|nr:hypothetical protein [Devosia nanyangense]
MKVFWDKLVRWRTWIVNIAMAVLVVLPEIVTAPEFVAVLPIEYQRYLLAAGFLINILMRPRAAVRADDPEAEVTRMRKQRVDFTGEL